MRGDQGCEYLDFCRRHPDECIARPGDSRLLGMPPVRKDARDQARALRGRIRDEAEKGATPKLRKYPEGWVQVKLLLPKSWLPRIEKARGDMERNKWIRDLIRDALLDAGVWPGQKELKLDASM
ncbi:MAG: hypothetical protein OEZ48_00040 [Candidatus Bathyarchaeota archaeon]|nr:hypothetical protein [Candidatus Bathyarchaeota archaeon]MDH5686245.1 hypothetical protein [Candidatus Bathyarchaeota archaeon]